MAFHAPENQSKLLGSVVSIIQENFTTNLPITLGKLFCFVAIIFTALFGNGLVLIAVLRVERLRTVRTNTFLVSLALADFLVALIVMPFNASLSLLDGHWIFGTEFCNIFNANDVLFSTASILHMGCISTERYIAVTDPLRYESKMRKSRVIAMLVVTWILSTLISYVPIFSGIYTTTEHLNRIEEEPYICHFVVNPYYAVISSAVSFWVPSFVMVVIYSRILIEARKQERKISRLKMLNSSQTQKRPREGRLSKFQLTSWKQSSETGRLFSTSKETADLSVSREQLTIKRENKAAKTLAIVMGAFLLCWFPFFAWYTSIHIFCGYEHCAYPPIIKDILFWVGYFNSTLNPIIYAYYNRSFRSAFEQILNCRREKPWTIQTNNNPDNIVFPTRDTSVGLQGNRVPNVSSATQRYVC